MLPWSRGVTTTMTTTTTALLLVVALLAGQLDGVAGAARAVGPTKPDGSAFTVVSYQAQTHLKGTWTASVMDANGKTVTNSVVSLSPGQKVSEPSRTSEHACSVPTAHDVILRTFCHFRIGGGKRATGASRRVPHARAAPLRRTVGCAAMLKRDAAIAGTESSPLCPEAID